MKERKEYIQEILTLFRESQKKMFLKNLTSNLSSKITPAQMPLLGLIDLHPDISIKELSKILGISSSAVTQLVDNMVNNNLLIRKESPVDRRVVNLSLSENSKEIKQEFEKIQTRHAVKMFTVLDDKEVQTLHNLIAKVLNNN